MAGVTLSETEHVSLVEAVDRVLNKGAVIAGEVTIAVADIDLIRLGLQLVLASTDTLLDTSRLLSLGGGSPKPTGQVSREDPERSEG